MGLTCREVSGSEALNSGSSVYVMFPLTFCYLSSGGYFTQNAEAVVDTQWKQSTHHLAPALLKQCLGILFKRSELRLKVLWCLLGKFDMQPIR